MPGSRTGLTSSVEGLRVLVLYPRRTGGSTMVDNVVELTGTAGTDRFSMNRA